MSRSETGASGRLKKLAQMGQSPWYDNIDRVLLENGQMKALIDRGILGVTTNPTIFEKAIQESAVYDSKILRMKAQGLNLEQIYDEVTAGDVGEAADLFRDVYERTQGIDGYVSIEVLPAYARDPEKTIDYAHRIVKRIGRPNIMVKVPGTVESAAAVERLTEEGINVNVTLLFSVEQYEQAALAFIRGIERRLQSGGDISRIASVASVFVSRIDTKVDAILTSLALSEKSVENRARLNLLRGKIALANAKQVYQSYKKLFQESQFFKRLKIQGVRDQRLLWASTGTKNSLYSDCLYVDNLIGPSTVNTMPPQTIEAFEDHGEVAVTMEKDLAVWQAYLTHLRECQIDLSEICAECQREGLAAFERSFANLMSSLEKRSLVKTS